MTPKPARKKRVQSPTTKIATPQRQSPGPMENGSRISGVERRWTRYRLIHNT